MITVIWIWAIVSTLWAIIVSTMLIRNPLPVPDRGHRAYSIPGEEARLAVLQVLSRVGKLHERFTFDAGPTHQTLMWDGYTVLNFLDRSNSDVSDLSGNAISLAVHDPRSAAEKALQILKARNFTATARELADNNIPANHLIVIDSEAFDNWVLVFRRHLIKMPKVERRKVS